MYGKYHTPVSITSVGASPHSAEPSAFNSMSYGSGASSRPLFAVGGAPYTPHQQSQYSPRTGIFPVNGSLHGIPMAPPMEVPMGVGGYNPCACPCPPPMNVGGPVVGGVPYFVVAPQFQYQGTANSLSTGFGMTMV